MNKVAGTTAQCPLNAQRSCVFDYRHTVLVLGIVHHQGNGDFQRQCGDLSQQLTDTFSIDVGIVGDRDQFQCQGIDRAQHVEALATCRRLDEQACERPQKTEERGKDKMRGIYKKRARLPSRAS